MLIICNGAFKSGSSWLHAILVELTIVKNLNLQKVPVRYTNDINSPTTIIESRLKEFLTTEDYVVNNYLTKSHFFKESTLRQNYPSDVKILFIERDRRDAIVSHYFHVRNRYRFKIGFPIYYALIGRYKAYEIGVFNERCRKYMGHENFFYYSDLILDFEATVMKIANVIGVKNISKDEISRVKEQTTLDKLREELKKGNLSYYPSKNKDNWKLFREGKVGGRKDYFNSRQLLDIEKIEDGKFSVCSKIIYFLMFTLRRIIFRIE